MTSITPPNGTEVTREIGAVNVTFECAVMNDQGMQDTTQWNIENFRGNLRPSSILMALNDTILEGEPSNGVLATFRTRLIFPEFLEDLDGTTLTCGLPPASSLRDGQFQLRVYSKSLWYLSLIACTEGHSKPSYYFSSTFPSSRMLPGPM